MKRVAFSLPEFSPEYLELKDEITIPEMTCRLCKMPRAHLSHRFCPRCNYEYGTVSLKIRHKPVRTTRKYCWKCKKHRACKKVDEMDHRNRVLVNYYQCQKCEHEWDERKWYFEDGKFDRKLLDKF